MASRKGARARRSDYSDVGDVVAELLGRLFAVPEMEHEQVGVTISIPMFRKLIALCHPDKHNNSEMSQEVTRWLIDAREKSSGTKR